MKTLARIDAEDGLIALKEVYEDYVSRILRIGTLGMDDKESSLRGLKRYDMRFEQTGYVGYEINAEEYEEGDWVKWEDIELILNNK